jgi:3D-(3,5/4)-trihydroxycyclohexane-1,2-dione acylhydrolase (decyclizing)
MSAERMTVSQALIRFLARQWSVDVDAQGNERRERVIPAVFGIFGHGNVAGLGQALLQFAREDPAMMPYHQARNEQAMVHQSVGFARMRRRRATFASTASVGPGSTNMITGAALATINRLPALLLPSDTFATRVADPVLQQLEVPGDATESVNDAFRPVSRFFDRVQRPEQLFSAAIQAVRVLMDPVETGAVTIALPEDVQVEALDVPAEFLETREWRIRRPLPEPGDLARALDAIRGARRPLIVAGGGVIYSDAAAALAEFAEASGIAVATTQAGVGAIPWQHPLAVGAVGSTGTTVANRLAERADLVIGIGTRFSDFTTASRTAFQNPDVRFVTINVVPFDAVKLGAQVSIAADARAALTGLVSGLGVRADARDADTLDPDYRDEIASEKSAWLAAADATMAPSGRPRPAQSEIIGAVLRSVDERDVVVAAAGSLPGDLHKLWRVRDDLGYHVEYGYSCMGYEIPGGLGVRRADPTRDVVVMVGDGSYLMMHTELVTAVAEGIKVIVVLVQNDGYASIGALSETIGSDRYGTAFRYRDDATNSAEQGARLPVDLAANAASLGVEVIRVEPGPDAIGDLEAAMAAAKASSASTVIHIESDPLLPGPGSGAWWEVPVAEVSALESTRRARAEHERQKSRQRPYLG